MEQTLFHLINALQKENVSLNMLRIESTPLVSLKVNERSVVINLMLIFRH